MQDLVFGFILEDPLVRRWFCDSSTLIVDVAKLGVLHRNKSALNDFEPISNFSLPRKYPYG